VVQKTGERQGNPCPAFYTLASAQDKGSGPEVFHDILEGGNSVPGTPGYPCTPGYDLATGLGSVDAQALVGAWRGGLGNNVDAVIREPAADLTLDSGTRVAFLGIAQESNPNASLTCAWSFGDGDGASGAAASHTFRNPSPAPATCQVAFTATDSSGAQGTDVRTITVLPAPPPGERIVNGGFEYGSRGWSAANVFLGNNSPQAPAHTGKADAWFSGWQNGMPELLRQTVLIPAGTGPALLSFWLHIDTYGVALTAVDSFQVKARGADGILRILAVFSNLDNAPDFHRRGIDLASYRGQRVELSFVALDAPDGVNSSFTLDDVSLIAP
jgi:hypothetical protein